MARPTKRAQESPKHISEIDENVIFKTDHAKLYWRSVLASQIRTQWDTPDWFVALQLGVVLDDYHSEGGYKSAANLKEITSLFNSLGLTVTSRKMNDIEFSGVEVVDEHSKSIMEEYREMMGVITDGKSKTT